MRFPSSSSAFAFSVFTSLFASLPAHSVDVLLLGDGEADAQVALALESAGHDVTVAGPYWEWDGFTPSAFDHQVVVLLSGENYSEELDPVVPAVLDLFLTSGCGLVTTEWTAYSVAQGFQSEEFGELLPVHSPNAEFGEGSIWLPLVPGHPLVAGLATGFVDDGGWSELAARPGAEVVMADPAQGGNPLLSYTRFFGGTSVHINHDLTYDLETVPANILRLLDNAVRFATCTLFRDDFESGGPGAWDAQS
jgi:hypothetical protein